MILRKMINKLWSRVSLSFWSYREILSLKRLAREFKPNDPDEAAGSMTVVVEGFLGMQFVAVYYILLLLILRGKSGRKIRVILMVPNRRDRYFTASRIYGLFFQTRVVVVNDFLSSYEIIQVGKHVAHLVSQIREGQDLFDAKYQGIRLGRDIYYAYLRNKLVGTLDVIDDEVVKLIHTAIQNAFVAEKVIADYQPELLLITDNCYATFSPYFHVFLQQKITVALTVMHGAGTGKICGRVYRSLADTEGVPRRYPFSFDDVTWRQLRENFGAKEDDTISEYLRIRFAGLDATFNGDYHKNTSSLQVGAMRERLSILPDDKRRIVLIAAHLFWDDPGYDGLYRDYEIWLKDTLQTIACNSNVIWILKAHPSEKHMSTNRYVKEVVSEVYGDELPSHILFLDADTDINTYSLIDFSDAVLTVRGTIGFESACKGKRVICAGYGPFARLGFSFEFGSQDEYRKCLLNLHAADIALSDEQISFARIGLYGYFIKKAPVSQVMIRGDDIEKYADLTKAELFGDPTLNRFAGKILSNTSGDLL